MITQAENAATIAANAHFTTLAADYKALLAANDFPLTIDVELIKTTLRTQLFQKLLGADKGLKMRFDMLKSNEARLKLIGDTIDLTGYDIIDDIASAVKELERAYNGVYSRGAGFIKNVVSFTTFADVCELDLGLLLDSKTYDFTGREHVLEYFRELGQHLQQLREILRVAVSSSYTLGDSLHVLGRFYTGESGEGDLTPDQGAVMRLVTDLEKVGKLAMIPQPTGK
ncbi:hypothetical protein ACFST9_17915 [Hymenobacter monticola]|uniref:Uncharacterized protein n=1 Tax=Hymenobacter monticola TaxID=1705399 RepID=A0ABY4B2E7_9BACT|nr:hypothetical protein [Hymenobacter monticola]UOE32216.1 hypothetical protein MTP16_13860 [Hymenobacter monticola]